MRGVEDLRRWLLRGSLVTLLGRVAFGAFTILQNAVLARLLEGADLGAYLLTQTVILPGMLLALWGNDLLAVAWIGAERNLLAVLLSGASVVCAASLAVGFSATFGVKALAAVSATWALAASWHWWLVPLIVLLTAQTYVAAVFRGLRQIGKATLLNGVLSCALLLALTTAAYAGNVSLTVPGVIALQAATLAAVVGWGAFDLLVTLRRDLAVFVGPLKGVLRATWVEGGPLMLTQLLAFVVTQSDIWIVSSYAPPADVAGYALAARLAQLVSLPQMVLNGVLPPLMASWFASQDVARLNRVIGTAVQAALGLAFGLAGFYAVAGGPMLRILFHGYAAWFDVLMILTLGNVVNVAAGPCSQMLIMAGQGRTLLCITALTCALCCGFGLPAGVWFGPRGTAVVFAAGLTVQGIVSAYWTRKRTRVRTYPSLALPSWQELR